MIPAPLETQRRCLKKDIRGNHPPAGDGSMAWPLQRGSITQLTAHTRASVSPLGVSDTKEVDQMKKQVIAKWSLRSSVSSPTEVQSGGPQKVWQRSTKTSRAQRFCRETCCWQEVCIPLLAEAHVMRGFTHRKSQRPLKSSFFERI